MTSHIQPGFQTSFLTKTLTKQTLNVESSISSRSDASGKETLPHEHFLKQLLPQDFCDIQGTRSRLTACLSPERGAQEKKLITELLLSFLPQVPLHVMISLPCGSDLLLLQHLLSSLPSPKHSRSEGSLGRRNQTNCSQSSWLVWSLEMLQSWAGKRVGLGRELGCM